MSFYDWLGSGEPSARQRFGRASLAGSRSMGQRTNGRRYECVVVDLNTQIDFCDRDGNRPVANRERLIQSLRCIIAWTKRNQAPIVSSMESHRESDLDPFTGRICCRDGSSGQQKISFTIFGCHTHVEVDNTLSCSINLLRQYQQIIFRQRSDDLLANPKADRFFTQLPAMEFIVFGVGLESAVKTLTLGLLAREKRVTVIADACGYWSEAAADLAIRQMTAKGAHLGTVESLLARKLPRRFRYPNVHRPRAPRSRNGNAGKRGNGRIVSTRANPTIRHLPIYGQRSRITGRNGRLEQTDH